MSDPIVTRTLGMDFIYLDLVFLAVFMFFLIRKKYWLPLIWGIVGWGIYLIVDYYVWYIVLRSRTYSGPINPHLFFLWFCFSPGFSQFAYCFIMLEKRNFREIIGFTLLYFLGWVLVGTLSQLIPIDDRIIEVSRDMSAGNQRLIMTFVALGNVILALILRLAKKIRWEDFIYLFIVGTLVELNLELSLLVSGIRLEQGTWSFGLMVVNTLVEFNVGIVPMWLIFRGFLKMRDEDLALHPLSYMQFRFIKTDYNRIMVISHSEQNLKNRKIQATLEKIYKSEKIARDLGYLNAL